MLLLVIGVTTGLAFFMAPWRDQFHQVLEGSEKHVGLLGRLLGLRCVFCVHFPSSANGELLVWGPGGLELLESLKMKGIVT